MAENTILLIYYERKYYLFVEIVRLVRQVNMATVFVMDVKLSRFCYSKYTLRHSCKRSHMHHIFITILERLSRRISKLINGLFDIAYNLLMTK